MTKIKKQSAKILVCLLVIFLLAPDVIGGGLIASARVESVGGSDSLVRTSLDEIKNILTSVVYSDYLSLYSNVKDADDTIQISLADYLKDEQTTATVEFKDNFENSSGVLLVGDDGKISFEVNVAKEAMYSMELTYFTGDVTIKDKDGNVVSQGRSSSIERMILIDGKVPFKEARSIVLERFWVHKYNVIDAKGAPVLDESGNEKIYYSNSKEFKEFVEKYENNQKDSERLFLRDINGNELKPEKSLYKDWNTAFLTDSTGYYNEPLKFRLTEGKHVITIDAIKEPTAIKSITLKKSTETPSYEQYLESHKDAPDYNGDQVVMIQAEYPSLVSEQTIYQLNDRTSTITIPQDAALVRLNQIGGDKWQYVGQWIEYTVKVPETGFYTIIPRSKQDIYSGMYVSRRILINGETPFKEASFLRFNYSDQWITDPLNDGKTPFKFYLEKDKEVKIRFEVVLGNMAEVLRTVESSLNQINLYYRKILMITGPDADENRDYFFERLIPDVVSGLKQQAGILENVTKRLQEITGEKGEHAAALDKVAIYLRRMGEFPNTIAASMGTLKDYCGSLGTWLTDTQNQPLYFDYIAIQAVGSKPPKAEPGFFSSFWGEIQKFYVSFFADYNSIGSMKEEGVTSKDLEKVSIEVWTASSREQAQIIRGLVDDDFAKNYNIPVEVKLVVGGTLLPATLAGTGPDVSMSSAQGDPINFAIRSAVKSLNTKTGNTKIGYNFNDFSQWKDHPVYSKFIDKVETFDKVKERFAPAAMVPITLYGETYALPETMSFSMMFYRKDIFTELGITVPNTWDDFYDIIYTLQSNVLDIAFPAGLGGSMTFMYQQGVDIYKQGKYDEYLDLYHNNGYTDNDLLEKGWAYYNEEGKLIPKTDGMEVNLDNNIALSTFKDVCQLFTMYDFPVAYSLENRFRQGIMPLAIANYSFYNQLIVFAPEIKGLWEFTPLPGTANASETIDNTTIAGISTMIMMKTVTDDNAFSAWTFMQWWTGAYAQSAYANEMIALLGPSAKQATANLKALENMSWSKDEYDNLKAQFAAVKCVPTYPGSYIIDRYASFAFLGVYNENKEPVETLLAQITPINTELSRKRKEFGLPIIEDFIALKNNQKIDRKK